MDRPGTGIKFNDFFFFLKKVCNRVSLFSVFNFVLNSSKLMKI